MGTTYRGVTHRSRIETRHDRMVPHATAEDLAPRLAGGDAVDGASTRQLAITSWLGRHAA
jgi:hypothetical protein